MTKKQVFLLISVVLLFCAYVYYFTDWFASESIQIVHTLRPVAAFSPARRPGRRGGGDDVNPAVNSVSFGFDRKLQLTEVKVIPLADLATNKYAHPIWHLVSESNSVPTKALVYGMSLRGMHPKVPNARPDPLEPGVAYRLLIQTSDVKAEHDFQTTARAGATK